MNQTNTYNNIIIYARCPWRLSLVEKYTGMSSFMCGHAPHHGASPHKNILLHFAKYFLFPVETILL